jgi:multidrug transporter EmrE-like cation transporter
MLATIALALAGQIVYQLGQRAVPHDASPLIVLAAAYFGAGVLCLAFAWPLGALNGGTHLRSSLSWPTGVIAISIVAIELGYLTAYRSGWTLGTAFATASTATVFGLAVVGRVAFANPLSMKQVLGLVLSSGALWLLSTG